MSSAQQLVAGVQVRVGGSPLSQELADALKEVRVDDSLTLPGSFLIRLFADPSMSVLDSATFDFGKEVEIQFQAPDKGAWKTVLKGEVTTVEPEFDKKGVVVNVRGYAKSHRLNRTRKSETFQDQTYADIARAVISGAGVSAGTVDERGGVQKFVQRSNETAWDFLNRLANRIDFEVVADEQNRVHFRKAGGPSGAPEKTLKWGDKLEEFRPRLTSIQQLDSVIVRGWDPERKQAIVSNKTASSLADRVGSKIGIKRSKVANAFPGGKLEVGDRVVTTQAEADALSESSLSKLMNAYLEATGRTVGDPDLVPGVKLKVEGVGRKYGGTYVLTEVTHVYKGEGGYQTTFKVSGRTPRGLVDMISAPQKRNWGSSIVIGTVTNNDDPDGMGRVRVKFPSLDSSIEGWWARIASPSAGKDRGLLMMPIPGDEVLVAFEHDDPRRPYVIGSVWNKTDKPNDLVQKDGSFVLQSDKLVKIKSKGDVSVKGDKAFSLETTGKISQKSSDSLTIEASQEVGVKAMKININANADITIKATGKLSIEASGMLSVQAGGVLTLKGASVMLG